MNKKNLFIAAALIAVTIGFIACKKDSDKNSTLVVRLTDNPVAYEEVNVDIKEVRVKLSEEASDNEWITLTTNAGIYDLLTLQGVDTALATGVIPSATVKQIRLILGSENTIKSNGVLYPLEIPSGSESGLKIMLNKKLEQPLETLVIDFDAALSVSQDGNGDYKLRPVIKEKN